MIAPRGWATDSYDQGFRSLQARASQRDLLFKFSLPMASVLFDPSPFQLFSIQRANLRSFQVLTPRAARCKFSPRPRPLFRGPPDTLFTREPAAGRRLFRAFRKHFSVLAVAQSHATFSSAFSVDCGRARLNPSLSKLSAITIGASERRQFFHLLKTFSRLHQNRFLLPNMRCKTLAETYKMHSVP